MNRPSLATYALGNPVSYLLIIGILGLWMYHWYSSPIESVLEPILAAMAFSAASSANTQLANYKAWRLEWEATAGEPRSEALHILKVIAEYLAVVGVAAGIVYWLTTTPEYEIETNEWIGCVIILVALLGVITRPFRWAFRVAFAGVIDRRRARGYIVANCLPVAEYSPTLQQAQGALPDYCQQVLMPPRPLPAENVAPPDSEALGANVLRWPRS